MKASRRKTSKKQTRITCHMRKSALNEQPAALPNAGAFLSNDPPDAWPSPEALNQVPGCRGEMSELSEMLRAVRIRKDVDRALQMTMWAGMSLGELCKRVTLDYDTARYTLARNLLSPIGVEPHPGKGRHRRFTTAEAYYLAVALKVNGAGINLDLAGQIADWARKVQEIAVNGSWDAGFAPFAGQLTTTKKWLLEVGDGRLVRIVTNANPSKPGWDRTIWIDMQSKKPLLNGDLEIAVVIRVDLAKIARLLHRAAK